MLVHPQFDPVAISVGPLKVHWYGLMYLLAFLQLWWLGKKRLAARPELGMTEKGLDDLLFYGVLGVVLGGRLGQVLFYEPGYYLEHPAEILAVWKGGMSFHGGFLGVLVAVAIWARKHQASWLATTDFIAPLVPLGLAFGRIGNFINGELWGRPTDLSWGMMFPFVDAQPRHPSMLYQALLEGLALFLLLWFYSRRPRPTMAVSGLFLIGYGAFRFLVEFVREPDKHLGYLAGGWLTMGQVLTVPMIVAGLVLMLLAYRRAR
jgi:phosphatidylglycerol:prolipoprotein diacylglycerol transferase